MSRDSKYAPLTLMLVDATARGATELTVSFDVLDRSIPGGLPASARKYAAWWANSGQPHSAAWRAAGWLVDRVNQSSGMWVRFQFDGDQPELTALGHARQDEPEPRRIGFVAPEPGPATVHLSTTSPSADEQRSASDRIEVMVVVEWRGCGSITLDAAGRLVIPPLPSAPGLYRFTLLGPPCPVRPRMYLGEAENLSRRMSGYRTPGPTQTTNIRINATLLAHLQAGGSAEVAVATECSGSSGSGTQVTPLPLSMKSVRLLAESAAIVASRQNGNVHLENACEATNEKFDPAA